MNTSLSVGLLLCLLLPLATGTKCRCTAEVAGPLDPSVLPNAAQKVTSILISLIPGTPGIPHQLAVVAGAMFDAHAFATGRSRLTSASPALPSTLSTDDLVGYAGYSAMHRIFSASNPDKVKALNKAMRSIGLNKLEVRDTIGAEFAEAVSQRFPLSIPPPEYKPPNPPSTIPVDAQCNAISDSDGWQPLCLPSSGRGCIPQEISFLPLVNASLIHRDGARKINELIADIPPPPKYRGGLKSLPSRKDAREFARPYIRVLSSSQALDDDDKTVAEVFQPNAALGVLTLSLDEVSTRELDLGNSVNLFFAVSAGIRDALVGSSTIKLLYSTIRPITLIQCAYRGKPIRTWAGPYKGVQSFRNSKNRPWRPYIQTPANPGYISGHTSAAGAGAQVLRRFFNDDKPKAANCFVRKPGESLTEPRIEKGEPGYIAGVTDVPNKGFRKAGFSPAKKITICWNTWKDYENLMARSRVTGGVHTPLEN